jgi:hypothetical protein
MKVLSLDPGESTGYCIVDWPFKRQIKPREDLSSYLVDYGQIVGKDIMKHYKEIVKLIKEHNPDVIVYEKFLLYGHRAESQIGSDMFTPQVIGQIRVLAAQHGKPEISNTAQVAKLFYTDSKLREHNMWQPGMRHARDAIRHALYAIDFNLFKNRR